MRRLLPLLLVLVLCQGCFVFDELDKGEAIMDAHSPNRNKHASDEAPPPPASQDDDEGSLLTDLKDGVVGLWTEASEPKPPERDPDDVPVACAVSGQTVFVRKTDCIVRGGRIL